MQDAFEADAKSMISCMQVKPLDDLMPPNALVDELERFDDMRSAFERQLPANVLDLLERELHVSLGGHLERDS
jgi:hypothetical protein